MSALARLTYAIPMFGWMLRDAAKGKDDAKIWFVLNLVGLWLCAIGLFGLPALILPALCAVPAIFVVLILLTWGK